MSKIPKKKNIDWLINNYMVFFEEFGMNKSNIIDYYYTWKKNRPDIVEDYLWYLFNHLLSENAKQSSDLKGFYLRNMNIYSHMIHFRRKFENKKANQIQKLYNTNKVNYDLESDLIINFEIEFLVIGGHDCEESKKISEKTISIKEALENEIIPYTKCTRKKGCICEMGMRAKRDANGKLIRKKIE